MKQITVFKDLYSLKYPKYTTIEYVLEKIKEGSCKDIVDSVRSENDKSLRNQLKKKLPCVLFSGEFTERADNAIVNHSGFICLDFDGFEDEAKLRHYRDFLSKDKYTYAVFTSPSGDGLKTLVKIPDSHKEHRMYFNALKEHYNTKYFDESCVNESRICYMSYDPDVFVNEDSFLFDKKIKPKEPTIQEVKVPVVDNDRIISGLYKWWSDKYGLIEGGRNRNVFILSMAFNEFGIPEIEAKSFMVQLAQEGFDEEEIKSCVESAYRKSHLFNTKSFDDDVRFDTYTPASIESKSDDKTNINFHNIYQSSFVDVKKKIEYPPIALSIGTQRFGEKVLPVAFGTYGNFSCIVGPSKTKKTFLKSLLVGSYIGGDSSLYASSIKSHRDRDCFIIDIDTEQSVFHAQNVFKRTMNIVGVKDYEFYKPFALRPYEPKQRLEFIEWLIYESDMKDNIGLVSIDGLADLVDDFNDLKESQKAIQKIMKWTDDKQFHLTTILHSNYGSSKAVGHIGSSVLKKAETVVSVSLDDGGVKAEFTHTRGFPISPFVYDVLDKTNIPYIVGDYNDDRVIQRKERKEPLEDSNSKAIHSASPSEAFDIPPIDLDEIPF